MRVMAEVANALVARGLTARTEQTGGGVVCVFIAEGEHEWCCGTANETWGGDLVDVNGELVGEEARQSQHLTTTVDAESDEPELIAEALLNAIAQWRVERVR